MAFLLQRRDHRLSSGRLGFVAGSAPRWGHLSGPVYFVNLTGKTPKMVFIHIVIEYLLSVRAILFTMGDAKILTYCHG